MLVDDANAIPEEASNVPRTDEERLALIRPWLVDSVLLGRFTMDCAFGRLDRSHQQGPGFFAVGA